MQTDRRRGWRDMVLLVALSFSAPPCIFAVNQPPAAVSVTPSSGSGSSQTFSFLYSDPDGFADLPWAQMVFNVSLSAVNSCYAHYDRPSNKVWLLNDGATAWLGPVTLGIAVTVQNSQCIVNAGGSSSSKVGTNLTVNLALTFKPVFNGAKNVYLQTRDASGLVTGWQQRGTWTVGSGPTPLTITTVSPLASGNQGVFYSQTLEATGGTTPYTWSVGPGRPPGLNLSSSGVLSGTPTTVGTYIFTVQVSGGGTDNKVFSLTIAGPANLAPAAVSVTPSSGGGSIQTFAFLYSDPNGFADLPWAQMFFHSSLSSPVNACYVHYDRPSNGVWLLNDGGTTWLGPVTLGIAGTLENSQCIVTAGGSSSSKVGTNLTVNLALTFKPAFAGAKNIYMQTQDAGGLVTGWQQRGTWTIGSGPAALTITTVSPLPGGNQDVFYSQTLEATGGTTPYTWSVGAGLPPGLSLSSSGVLSGTPSTIGTYNFSVQVSGGGTATKPFSLTIGGPTSVAPTAVSVTPSSGSGSSQTFAFLYSDPNGFADLPWAQMVFHVNLNSPVNSCYAHYNRPANLVWLLNDGGTTWLGPVGLGIGGTVENSQCIVNAGDSSSSGVGTDLTVNLALTFKPAFAGAKNIYMQTQDEDGLATGWQQRGTWTVSGP